MPDHLVIQTGSDRLRSAIVVPLAQRMGNRHDARPRGSRRLGPGLAVFEHEALDAADAIIFGSPTYMGMASWQFKKFADATSKRWFTSAWKDKVAGGFTISATLITLVGAVASPRWVYVEPLIVFNPTVSFLTVIMALLGGANRLWGPLVGAIPLFLLFEWLSVNFPDTYPIFLGLMFIAVVFVLPNGVLAGLDDLRARLGRRGK